MSLAATVRAMVEAGMTAEQIADVVDRMEEARKVKARAGNAERQRRWRENHNANNANNGVTGVTSVTKERPHTPKENTPPPSDPLKGSSVGAPKGAQPEGGRRAVGTRLPPDWQPSEADREFARSKGFDDRAIDLEAEKIRNWSASSPKGVCRDWSARWRNWVLATTPPARAGPGSRQPTLAEMSRMDEPGFSFDDPQPAHRHDPRQGPRLGDLPAEGAANGDARRGGFAGRLSIADRDDRRHHVVDH